MISIKDIARLSNVSITTVSKIINNKADDISQETIDKVLKIVKEYNYTPYRNARKHPEKKSFTICLLLRKMHNVTFIINGLIQVLTRNGYTLMLLDSNESIEVEEKNLSKISFQNPDGIIWEPVCEDSIKNMHILANCNAKIVFIDHPNIQENCYNIDFRGISYFAASTLVKKGHTSIGCVVRKESHRTQSVIDGFRQCLFDNNIPFRPEMILPFEELQPEDFRNKSFSGLITSHYSVAQELTVLLKQLNISVPYELSLLSLTDDIREDVTSADISTINIPHYEFGLFVGEKIISLCESKIDSKEAFLFTPTVSSYKTIDIPSEMRSQKITVVGSINIDNIVYLDQLPSPGVTSFASKAFSIPGGKGLNQAIGVAMQKKDVTLIGKIGKDTEGSIVHKTLSDHGIETSSIITNYDSETGKAFILVEKKGDSIITITEGANSTLSPSDITDHAKCFENTGICLLQTEVPLSVIREAAKIAKEHHALTILKPASITIMEDDDYKNIDIFVPNRKEALVLSGKSTVEEAADFFLTKGPHTVIVTMDENGALLRTNNITKYYSAPNVDVIDTTGGSDAFISTLGVKLLEAYDLDNAINAATIAAGFCISKFGVSNSMIDHLTLERYLSYK